ncbi:uncharacterized protein LOC129313280 isoform X2 [Prosopis cineraria]|uniref:uncharacterized protein LOC129313280 isoform X2 n=1 Tax=Prosopis cineraria TaxID=364024 RepID=UPI00240F4CB7|nr:uncharacterized protein LOC129313280 isoform X2 [Prosopis cineraria]
MLGSENNLSSSSGITSSDMPPLPQCLPLDPITLGNKKNARSGELRKALGVPLGSTSEDHSLGVPHPKPIAPVASGELKHFKESVQDTSRKARDRAKMLRDSISKLDKFREALNSKKRQRTDFSADRGVGVNLTKMGSQLHRNSSDILTQKSEAKTASSALNKRIRTSVADVRAESRSVATMRQQDGNLIQTLGGSSVRTEEKTRRLLAGGDGLDHKIKKKRSVAAAGNRVTAGDRDVKRATLSKTSSDLKLRFYDPQGFRLKPLPGACGINKSESSSEPTNSGVRTTLGSEQEGASLHRDNMATLDHRVAKANCRANTQEDCLASCPNTLIKNKVSRAPRTGSVTALDSSSTQPSSGSFSGSGSSIHPMTKWIGQRPHKNSRSRRSNVVSPVSRNIETQVSSEGCPTPDFSVRASGVGSSQMASSVNNSTQKYKRPSDDISSPFGLSESEESGGGENKIKEKGLNNSDFSPTAEKAEALKLKMRKNKIPIDESGDCVQRQGRIGRNLSFVRPGLPSGREKTESLPIMKPLQNMGSDDKNKIKYGRPPSKKQKDRKVLIHMGQMLSDGSKKFSGECGDDREELYQAANSACNASNLACSSPFWHKMEPIFAPASLEDSSYLKQQLNSAEELDKSLSQMFDVDHDILGVLVNNEAMHGLRERKRRQCDEQSTKNDALSGKNDFERLDKVSPLFQRVISALIEEDEVEESYHPNEAKNTSRQCASDDSHCGSCNQIDFEPKDWDKMDSEVESKEELQIQKNFILDRLSCDKSTASNTFRYPNASSSLQSTGVWQGDEEFSHSDITHTSEICSNDLDQLPTAELCGPGFPSSDVQYQQMCLDDRLLLELQSIGIYPEILPDLAEEDEALNQDIIELKKGLHQQIGRKKKKLDRIDRVVQKVRDTERRKIEQVAYDKLIEIAYRKRMACRGSKNSKSAVHKVSRQDAQSFIKRALGRCKKFEETGNSCFGEPALQNIIFSTPSRDNDAKSGEGIVSMTASNTCNKVSHQVEAGRSVSSVSEKYDPHRDNADRGMQDSFHGPVHSSEQGSSKNGSLLVKEKKREMLVNGVGSFSRASNVDGPAHGGVKGKRSERDRNQSRDQSRHISISSDLSMDSSRNECKPKTKPRQKSNLSGHQDIFVGNAGNNDGKESDPLSGKKDTLKKGSSDLGNLQLHELDPMEELGVSGDLGGHQDLSSWFNFDEDDGLLEDDTVGLEIPMDDLSELNMLM